jgi:hypothetical protein
MTEIAESGNPSQYTLYVIEDEWGAVKIGVTIDLHMRLSSLQSANSRPVKVRGIVYCASESQMLALEGLLHRRYAHLHLRREWFDVDANDVINDLLFALRVAELGLPQQPDLSTLQSTLPAPSGYNRTADGQRRVIEYLNQHPEDAALPSRQLAVRIAERTGVSVGHDTANKGRNAWRNRQLGD